jgi:hypothetical protein
MWTVKVRKHHPHGNKLERRQGVGALSPSQFPAYIHTETVICAEMTKFQDT